MPKSLKLNGSMKIYKTLLNNKKKDVLFIIRDWNAKGGSQEIPGVTDKFGLGVKNRSSTKANSVAKRTHCSEQTPSSNNTRGDSTHGHHQIVNTKIRLIIFFVAKDGEALYRSAGKKKKKKKRPGADCGSDHELLIAKFKLKLKKVGETNRPFMYDLNQIPYNYTVEMTNRFERVDLIDRVPKELWTEVRDIVLEAVIKTIPKKKKFKKAKWFSD